MKISELIAELQTIKKHRGDIEIRIKNQRCLSDKLDQRHFFCQGHPNKETIILAGDA